jgi:hypothetical protein
LTLKDEARKLEQSESPATGSHGAHWQTVTAHAVGVVSRRRFESCATLHNTVNLKSLIESHRLGHCDRLAVYKDKLKTRDGPVAAAGVNPESVAAASAPRVHGRARDGGASTSPITAGRRYTRRQARLVTAPLPVWLAHCLGVQV